MITSEDIMECIKEIIEEEDITEEELAKMKKMAEIIWPQEKSN